MTHSPGFVDCSVEPTPQPLFLQWNGEEIALGEPDGPVRVRYVSLEIQPAFSVAFTYGTQTVVSFAGEAVVETESGTITWRIDEEYFGSFFARVLYDRDAELLKFSLPAAFEDPVTKQRRQVFLGFQCNQGSTRCTALRSVFGSVLKVHTTPQQRLKPLLSGSDDSEDNMSPTPAGGPNQLKDPGPVGEGQDCCLDHQTGLCTCKPPEKKCPNLCPARLKNEEYPDVCDDCVSNFLCACSGP